MFLQTSAYYDVAYVFSQLLNEVYVPALGKQDTNLNQFTEIELVKYKKYFTNLENKIWSKFSKCQIPGEIISISPLVWRIKYCQNSQSVKYLSCILMLVLIICNL